MQEAILGQLEPVVRLAVPASEHVDLHPKPQEDEDEEGEGGPVHQPRAERDGGRDVVVSENATGEEIY